MQMKVTVPTVCLSNARTDHAVMSFNGTAPIAQFELGSIRLRNAMQSQDARDEL